MTTPLTVPIKVPVRQSVCTDCKRCLTSGKKFHVYNHDFCSIKCLMVWRVANPDTIHIAPTQRSSSTSEGWGNAF